MNGPKPSGPREKSQLDGLFKRVISVAVLGILLAFSFGCPSQWKGSVESNGQQQRSEDSEGSKLRKQGIERFCNSEAVAGQVLVKFRHPENWQDTKELEALATKITDDRVIVELVGNGDVVLVRSRSARSVEALKRSFDSPKYSGDIEYAGPDYIVPLDCKEPSSGHNRYLSQQWGLDKISACPAWTVATGEDTVVAVIDSGIDCKYETSKITCNEDLKDNVWLPPPGFSVRLAGRDVTCPTGCFGFDAMVDDSESDTKKWYPTDYSGHGTQVSGIIAAANNDTGVVGVSFNSKVMVVQYASEGSGFVSSIKRTIDFVIAASEKVKNLRVVNCSFGFDPNNLPACDSQTLRASFERLDQKNILVVASNGDVDGVPPAYKPHYPSGYALPNVLAVTSTNSSDGHSLSAYNPLLSNLIGAPGEWIYTTKICGYETNGGSSFAAPFVSGSAALVLSYTKNKCDQISAKDLRKDILESADEDNWA
jgi:subtilisin family serine protease